MKMDFLKRLREYLKSIQEQREENQLNDLIKSFVENYYLPRVEKAKHESEESEYLYFNGTISFRDGSSRNASCPVNDGNDFWFMLGNLKHKYDDEFGKKLFEKIKDFIENNGFSWEQKFYDDARGEKSYSIKVTFAGNYDDLVRVGTEFKNQNVTTTSNRASSK